jgi:1,4-dihydroxy-2-naphthoate octaprenyltransferase
VAGTYYVQSFELNGAVILMGFACGFLSTAVLVVNNLRDIATDRRAGKRTLAVRFGPQFARNEYLFCLLAAGAIPPLAHVLTDKNPLILMASMVVFACIPLVGAVYTSEDGKTLNEVLARTGQALLAFCLIFSLAWIL